MKWPEASLGDNKRYEIIATLLNHDEGLLNFLFAQDKKAEMHGLIDVMFDRILYSGFSSGEKILCELACDFWFGLGQCFDITRRLDDDNFKRVIEAMIAWRAL